ncbi:phosphotransferase [Luteipulveratus flavus]|uniref:Aminoglycoside phosphotransferase family protein n=1 Tax=Luteipulveratus flavus TaxID=3031728 RepID=A0ABT6CC90_9MICO|nr:aminoglycoside phosphotransferase family protein [Luteipulveratus sp. YIM 133296]MDF8266506.1 aminoglycoside phosphotransferase family protein [Luteipulveratus sp. YIM 133296]
MVQDALGDEVGERLPGGNVGGAWRVGDTVRRTTGPWSPAVHAMLRHLERAGLRCAPRFLGIDALGREALTYLPGQVVDVDSEQLTDAQLTDLAAWTRELHVALVGFDHPGPWRFPGPKAPITLGHNDIAPYNVCFDGDRLTGVFDWDLAGPTTPLLELGHLAWNGVPLYRERPDDEVVRRLRLIAGAYGGVDAREVLHACLERTRLAIDGITAAVAAGDPGMNNLAATTGEPEPTRRRRAALQRRVPRLLRLLDESV